MARAKRVKQYTSLVFAYQSLMGGCGESEMDRAYFRLLVQAVVDGLSDRHADLMFDVLDIDRSGAITIAEFLRLPAVLALKFPHQLSEDTGTLQPSPGASDFDVMWAHVLRGCRLVAGSRWFTIAAGAVIVLACISGSLWSTRVQQAYDSCMCITYTQPNDDDPQPPGLYGSSSSQACVQGTNCSTYTVPVINALGLILSLCQVSVACPPRESY